VILPVFYILFSSGKFGHPFKWKPMKALSLILFFILGSSFFMTTHAQNFPKVFKAYKNFGKVNIHQAIQMALDSNLSVRSSAYSVEVQKSLKGASWELPKTSIEGQYGQYNSYTKDNSYTLSQSFAFPTVYINRNKLARENIRSAEWQLKASQLEIATQVKQVYWQLAYLHSKHKLFVYQDSLYAGFLRAAELRAKVGETNRLEMINARSQSLEVKNQLQQVTADLSIYNQKLQTILNTGSSITIADTVLQHITFSPVADSLALSTNPFVGDAQQQVEISVAEKKLEQSLMMPDFSVGFFSQTMQGTQEVNGISRTFGAGDRFNGIQAGIAIPLWFVPNTAKIKSARLKEQVSQANAGNYSKTLLGNYHSLLGEYNKFSNSVRYYEKQAVPEATIIIDQASRSYKAGAMDYLEYIHNLDQALSIRKNYLDALNDCNQTIISIDFITGKIF